MIRFFTQTALACLVCLGILRGTSAGPRPLLPTPPASPAEIFVPPPPVIEKLRLPAKDQGVIARVIDFVQGPCLPIIPQVIAAHQPEKARPFITKIVRFEHAGTLNLGQICDAFDYLNAGWKEFDDPVQRELIPDVSSIWETPAGDCEDMAVALSAGLTSIGAVTRINFVVDNGVGHAFTEVCLGRIPVVDAENYIRARYGLPEATTIHLRENENGMLFLNLDWSADYPGGPWFKGQSGAVFWPLNEHCETF